MRNPLIKQNSRKMHLMNANILDKIRQGTGFLHSLKACLKIKYINKGKRIDFPVK